MSETVETQSVLTHLASLSLEETRVIKRNFGLIPSVSSSSKHSESDEEDEDDEEATADEADELEEAIESLPERMVADQNLDTRPPLPDEDDPDYDLMLERSLVYQQWWALPGIDMNEGNNRTRFRSAYYRIAYEPKPYTWPGMTSEDCYWMMNDWDQRLRRSADENRTLASYSIRGQAELKQLPLDIDEDTFDFIFESEGRIEKVKSQTDFCQGKLKTYDTINFEIQKQSKIVRRLNYYKLQRKTLQETNKFVYRESKRFHDGTSKESHWMNLQEPNEKLADADAYYRNAVTHLRLTQLRTPDYTPYPPTSPPPTTQFPDRKFAKLRSPSPRITHLSTHTSLLEKFKNPATNSEEIPGAPGRPNARVRQRTGPYAKPLTLHFSGSKRSKRQLQYSQIRKTKTDRLLGESPMQDPVCEMSRLHWVLDDEGVFHDWRYEEDEEDLLGSRWVEMPPVGVVGVQSLGEGRRLSLD